MSMSGPSPGGPLISKKAEIASRDPSEAAIVPEVVEEEAPIQPARLGQEPGRPAGDDRIAGRLRGQGPGQSIAGLGDQAIDEGAGPVEALGQGQCPLGQCEPDPYRCPAGDSRWHR